jgi:hypothetical protein
MRQAKDTVDRSVTQSARRLRLDPHPGNPVLLFIVTPGCTATRSIASIMDIDKSTAVRPPWLLRDTHGDRTTRWLVSTISNEIGPRPRQPVLVIVDFRIDI